MTDEQDFGQLLAAMISMVPGCTLNEGAIMLYREAAAKIGFRKCSIAMKQLMAERRSRDPFPSIAEMLDRTEENAQDPEEISQRIAGAVSRIGPYRPFEAKMRLGPIAWDIVVMEGGWESICQMLTYENAGVLQAQWRNLARVLVQRKRTEKMRQVGFLRRLGVGELIEQIAGSGTESPRLNAPAADKRGRPAELEDK